MDAGIVWEADWTALYDSVPELRPSHPPHLDTQTQLDVRWVLQEMSNLHTENQEASVKCNELAKST